MTTPREEPSIYVHGPYDRPARALPATADQPPPMPAPPARNRRSWTIAIIAASAAVLVLMAAAGSAVWFVMRPTGTVSSAPQTRGAVAPPAPGSISTTTVTPSPTQPSVYHAGETVSWEDGLKVTAYSFSTPVATGAPKPDEPGYAWGAIDVQVCVPTEATINDLPWYLRYADNTTIEPSSTGYRQFPKPEYPSGDRNVVAGACTRGWITFAVPAGKNPVSIVYTTHETEPAEWLLG